MLHAIANLSVEAQAVQDCILGAPTSTSAVDKNGAYYMKLLSPHRENVGAPIPPLRCRCVEDKNLQAGQKRNTNASCYCWLIIIECYLIRDTFKSPLPPFFQSGELSLFKACLVPHFLKGGRGVCFLGYALQDYCRFNLELE